MQPIKTMLSLMYSLICTLSSDVEIAIDEIYLEHPPVVIEIYWGYNCQPKDHFESYMIDHFPNLACREG